MTTKAKLIILRHGQTFYNEQRLMTGQRDAQLTDLGKAQGAAAGEVIKHIHIDVAYSSTLSRAFNTAALALKAAGQENVKIEQRAALMELDAGEFAGRNIDTDAEIKEFVRTYGKRIPGGESDKDVVARIQKIYDEEILPALKRGETVLVSCHSGVVHAFDVVLGIVPAPADDEKLVVERVPNAAPNVYDFEDGKMTGHYFIENPATKAAEEAKKAKPPAAKKPANDKHRPAA